LVILAGMKSPFPGMDPYLESAWSNVHVLMMGAITAALNVSLPADLQARPEEEIRVESLAGERLRGYRADIAVSGGEAVRTPAASASTAVIAEPLRLPYQHAPLAVRDVRILDSSGRVVTVIEVLSPWNKLAGRLNRQYVRKLRDFEDAGTNWVEIDLLRSSRTRLTVTWDDVPTLKRSDYLVSAWRADDQDVSVWPISLRERLPTVKIPLREGDAELPLDLQAVFDRVYAEGRFSSTDYARPLNLPLSPTDRDWAAGLIEQHHH
jgi:Protein of unknown function (DUF4058)